MTSISTGFLHRISTHELDICLAVLAEIRETFWQADFTYQIFLEAQRKIKKRFEDVKTPARLGDPQLALTAEAQEWSAEPAVDEVAAENSMGDIDFFQDNDSDSLPPLPMDLFFPEDNTMHVIPSGEFVSE